MIRWLMATYWTTKRFSAGGEPAGVNSGKRAAARMRSLQYTNLPPPGVCRHTVIARAPVGERDDVVDC
ncbi:MAG TPA: hypothetical protein VFK57_01120 [Vicinamibacterales bacterium]|nr:hypothetical protein [Vicinamibacterales bacterium]